MKFYPEIMVDLETTGLRPDNAAILSIAAFRFNLVTLEIDVSNLFHRNLLIPPKRYWDEGTREFWFQQGSELYGEVTKDARPADEVMREFAAYAETTSSFWSKPTAFDYQFVESYFDQFGIMSPFKHWMSRDVRSFIAGLYFPNKVPEVDVPFNGTKHHPVWDNLHQVQTLFAHVRNAVGGGGTVLEGEKVAAE